MERLGLGDLIRAITYRLGLDVLSYKIAIFLGFKDCGCKERQKKFNKYKLWRIKRKK